MVKQQLSKMLAGDSYTQHYVVVYHVILTWYCSRDWGVLLRTQDQPQPGHAKKNSLTVWSGYQSKCLWLTTSQAIQLSYPDSCIRTPSHYMISEVYHNLPQFSTDVLVPTSFFRASSVAWKPCRMFRALILLVIATTYPAQSARAPGDTKPNFVILVPDGEFNERLLQMIADFWQDYKNVGLYVRSWWLSSTVGGQYPSWCLLNDVSFLVCLPGYVEIMATTQPENPC